ncbi:MAG: tetratricopeptide repeat protein [Acidobacteria bacterium]|nr:tetratricopeptide repeat protein [Acidobacteriota bacterium]
MQPVLLLGTALLGLAIGSLRAQITEVRKDLVLESGGGKRLALVIGNKSYLKQPLVNPVNDAIDMKAALEPLGFQVDLVRDASLKEMNDVTQSFTRKLREGDVALFYYSGHGLQIDSENLLVPVDFSGRTEPEVKRACFRFDGVKEMLERSPAALSILIMDACRNNPLRHTRDLVLGLAPVEAGLGSYLAFAASPGQVAADNPTERNGLFTKHLLEALRRTTPLSQIFRQVRDAVYEASSRSQLPFVHDQVIGDFYFRSPPVAVRAAREAGADASRGTEKLLERGKLLYHQGRCEEAFSLFEQSLRQSAENPFAHNATGVACMCLRRNAQAVDRFSMAIQLDPNFAAAYLNRGLVYQALAKYELAVQDFTWAIEQEPQNALFYWRRAKAHFGLRHYEEAMVDYNQSIQLNPSDPRPFLDRGQLHERQGRYREASADFQAALARKSDFLEARQALDSVRARIPASPRR